MEESIFIVIDKENYTMNIEMSEKLREIELKTPEERFCLEDETVCCYAKGTYEECQDFIKNLNDKEVQNCLTIRDIDDSTVPRVK